MSQNLKVGNCVYYTSLSLSAFFHLLAFVAFVHPLLKAWMVNIVSSIRSSDATWDIVTFFFDLHYVLHFRCRYSTCTWTDKFESMLVIKAFIPFSLNVQKGSF